MRLYVQWVLWRLEWREDDPEHTKKPTKIPYTTKGIKGNVTNPNTFDTFDNVCSVTFNTAYVPCDPSLSVFEMGFSGIGFVLTKNDPYAICDLDDTHGDALAYAEQIKIFQSFNSYSERSPSGRGLHIIAKAVLPGTGRRRNFIELYDNERYFTMTGDVYHNAPIECRQAEFEMVYNQLGGPPKDQLYGESQPQTKSDEEIFNTALYAVNGDKFAALYKGDWEDYYKSQSEADFAIIDIIGFYTENYDQIARIFWASELGKRDKAKRKDYVFGMIKKSQDRKLQKQDFEGIAIQLQKVIDAKAAARASVATGKGHKPAATQGPPEQGITLQGTQALAGLAALSMPFPPGLVGEIAQFIYDASPRPVSTIALAGAIGFLTGICGRSYNISNTGLNQYILVIAGTGRGKEAMSSGISKLMTAISNSVPAALDYRGPSEIASPQAILKWLSRAPCVYSIIGEFGLKLREMSDQRAGPSTVGLKRALLDLYTKSGKNEVLGAMAYSKKEDNTAVIRAPAFTLIAESTPIRFFENVNEDVILDGLLPRFMIMEYDGPRVEFNENHMIAMPTFSLVEKLAGLTAHCLSLANANNTCEVPMTEAARTLFKKFDSFTDNQINDPLNSVITHELFNRAHLKALKLAAIFAIGENFALPCISEANAQMAINEIYKQTCSLKLRFDKCEVGGGAVNAQANEEKQLALMVRCIGEFIFKPWESNSKKYKVTEELYNKRIYPYNSLHQRLAGQLIFKNDRRGGGEAIKRTYNILIDAGDIAEMPPKQMEMLGKKCRAFVIKDVSRFEEALKDE